MKAEIGRRATLGNRHNVRQTVRLIEINADTNATRTAVFPRHNGLKWLFFRVGIRCSHLSKRDRGKQSKKTNGKKGFHGSIFLGPELVDSSYIDYFRKNEQKNMLVPFF